MIYSANHKYPEILLIQPNLENARETHATFGQWNVRHRLSLFRSVSEAVRFLKRERMFARAPRPDLVLLDVDVSRYEPSRILAELTKATKRMAIPIVLLESSDRLHDLSSRFDFAECQSICKPMRLIDFLSVTDRSPVLRCPIGELASQFRAVRAA